MQLVNMARAGSQFLWWAVLARFVIQSASQAPSPSFSAQAINSSLLHYEPSSPLSAFPGVTFSGDAGCSPSGLLSYLTIQQQDVPVEEVNNLAVRVIQAPNTGSSSIPNNVVWLDLQTGVLISGIPMLNWTQQATVFNYTLLTPGLVDLGSYRSVLASLFTTVSGLVVGSQSNSARYRCSTSNPVLQPLMDYLTDIQEDLANASTIDNGLKKGIEYRVPSGCIVELDALYAGDAVGGVTNLTSGTTKQPTEDDCCQACKSQQGCNVFSFCPSFEGCMYMGQVYPAFGCQLKFLGNLSSDPSTFPAALARGPPTSFKSGRFG